MLAEEGSIAGIQRALECTKTNSEKSAKKFAAWAAGSRQLVAIARQARGLDAKGGADGDGAQINVMFVGALPRSQAQAHPAPRNITPDTQGQASAAPAAATLASGQTVDVRATPAT
jgi:hypothetical protein